MAAGHRLVAYAILRRHVAALGVPGWSWDTIETDGAIVLVLALAGFPVA
jgi:hypothetical protein